MQNNKQITHKEDTTKYLNGIKLCLLFFCKEVREITEKDRVPQKKKYGRTVKCPHCEEQLDRNIEEFVEHSKRYYHKECLENRQRAIEAKNKPRNDLISYICELHDTKKPSGFILKQIKDFESEYGYTPKEIEMCLRYFHGIKGNSVKPEYGIGIVLNIYEEAVRFYNRLVNVRDSAITSEFDNSRVTIKTIPEKNRRRVKKIDIGGL